MLLLLIIVVVGGGLGLALYFTGGALWFSKANEADETRKPRRPRHKVATSETLEHTNLAGTPEGEAAERRQRERQ